MFYLQAADGRLPEIQNSYKNLGLEAHHYIRPETAVYAICTYSRRLMNVRFKHPLTYFFEMHALGRRIMTIKFKINGPRLTCLPCMAYMNTVLFN